MVNNRQWNDLEMGSDDVILNVNQIKVMTLITNDFLNDQKQDVLMDDQKRDSRKEFTQNY